MRGARGARRARALTLTLSLVSLERLRGRGRRICPLHLTRCGGAGRRRVGHKPRPPWRTRRAGRWRGEACAAAPAPSGARRSGRPSRRRGAVRSRGGGGAARGARARGRCRRPGEGRGGTEGEGRGVRWRSEEGADGLGAVASAWKQERGDEYWSESVELLCVARKTCSGGRRARVGEGCGGGRGLVRRTVRRWLAAVPSPPRVSSTVPPCETGAGGRQARQGGTPGGVGRGEGRGRGVRRGEGRGRGLRRGEARRGEGRRGEAGRGEAPLCSSTGRRGS